MNYGTPTLNKSFIFCTGNVVYQPYSGTSSAKYSGTSSAKITYCAGYQQQYTISAGGGAYIPSVLSYMGSTITWTLSTSSVNENSNCPPTASGGFTTIYTIVICYIVLLETCRSCNCTVISFILLFISSQAGVKQCCFGYKVGIGLGCNY